MRYAILASLLILMPGALAHAEGPQRAAPQSDAPVFVEPSPPPAQPALEPPPSEVGPEEGRGVEYGAHLVVPIFLANNSDLDLSVGFGIQGRIGWEFAGGLTTELNVGLMRNASGESATAAGSAYADYRLTNLWFGVGARYAFLNPSALVPFAGVGLALNLFQNNDSHTSHLSVGFNGLVGVAYEVSPLIAVEAGLQLNYTLAPDGMKIAAEPEMWVSPFAGGTLYY